MIWLWIGVAAWVLITVVAIAFGSRAASQPWPEQDERWHKE